MILILGGTLEGREIAASVAGLGYQVLLTVVSGYGAELVPDGSSVEVLVGRLDASEIAKLVHDRKVKLIIDATHPYAGVISRTAWQVAGEKSVPFIRYERPPVCDQSREKVFKVDTYEKAAELAVTMGETIFLTIGSKNLEPFIRAGRMRSKRVVSRVLPDAEVLEQCAALGIAARDIIAIQGPFGLELNLAMLKEYQADVLVTKDSGHTGGTDTKLEAAARTGIPVIMVARPDYRGMPLTASIPDILEKVKAVSI